MKAIFAYYYIEGSVVLLPIPQKGGESHPPPPPRYKQNKKKDKDKSKTKNNNKNNKQKTKFFNNYGY